MRRLDGLLHGDYRTLFRGFGLDLADLREYQYHDDVRHIDWNVTARLQTPYVREYNEDREVTAWFLLDLSAVGRLRLGRRAQARGVDRLRHRARAPAHAARQPRRRAVLRRDDVDTVIPARSGRRHVLHLLHRDAAAAASTLQCDGTTNLSEFLRAAFPVMPRRSLVFVVSDFISAPGWDEPLAQLAQRHEVVAVRLYDPLETELPDLGMLTMRGRRDRRAAVRRHARPRLPQALRRSGRAARARAAHGVPRRRRRRARAFHRRRPRRRDPALRRPAQAAQPPGDAGGVLPRAPAAAAR